MQIGATTKIYGVLGQNISYSLSPLLHNACFQHFGMDAVYLAFSSQEERAENLLEALDTLQICGVNLTIPYKTKIIPTLKDLDPYAKKIQSINTLKRTEQGWKGYSTDGYGFLAGLSNMSLSLQETDFHCIGAGGAATAVAHALLEKNIKSLSLSNRNSDPLEHLFEQLKQNYPHAKIQIQAPKKGAVLVNCTPVGKDSVSFSAPKEWVEDAKAVIDLLYFPLASPLLRFAQSLGKPTQNGLPMLFHQARLSFEIWHQILPPIEVMEESIQHKL